MAPLLLLAVLAAPSPHDAAQRARSVPQAMHYAWREERSRWVAGHVTHRAEALPGGAFSVWPILDPDLGPRGQGLTATLERVAVGRTTLSTALRQTSRGPSDGELIQRRGAVEQRLLNSSSGVEVRWRFATRPAGRGDLTVRLRLDRDVAARDADGLHLPAGGGFVRIGQATWLTADGRSVALETRLDGRALTVVVPEAVWQHSAFPAEIDPVFGPERAVGVLLQEGPPSIEDDVAVGFDGTQFFVAWRDFRGGVGSDIYGTRVDTSGAVLDPGGLVIAEGPGGQYQPSIAFGGGQYYVAYSDTNVGGSGISGTRVTTAGQPLDVPGVTISSAAGLQTVPDVAWDGTSFLVVWEDRRAGSAPDIYGARVTPMGVVLDSGGLPVSTAAQGQYSPRVASDGAGQTLVVWEDNKNLEADIYATFVSTGGVVQNVTGLRINNSAGGQSEPDVAVGPANWLVVWQDARAGGFDVYGARVSLAGALLDNVGFPISAAANSQRSPAVAFGATDFVVTWDDDRNSVNLPDIYGARVSGATVVDPAGVPLITAAGAQGDPLLAWGGSSFYLAWQDARTGNADIWGAQLQPGLTVGVTALLSSAAPYQEVPVVAPGPTSSLVVWEEFRQGAYQVRYARVAADGTVLDSTPSRLGGPLGDQSRPAVALANGRWLVVWEDTTAGNADVRAAFIGADGLVQGAAFPVSNGAAAETSPAVAFDGTVALVTWIDARNATAPDLYAARVSTGAVVLDPSGIPLVTTSLTQAAPAATVVGGNFLVAYVEDTAAAARARGLLVSPAGAVLAGPGALCTTASPQTQVALATSGSVAFAAWTDERAGAGNSDVFGTPVSSSLMPLAPGGVPLTLAAGNQSSPTVTWDPSAQSWSVAWVDQVTEPWQLRTGELSADAGALLPGPSLGNGREPDWALGPAGIGLFAASTFDSSGGVQAWRVRVRTSGTLLPDAGPPDAGPPDAGPPDAGPPDAGPPDAGPPDAGPPDAGPPDAGPPDAGPSADAGSHDAGGGGDAGLPDGGAPDFTSSPPPSALCGERWAWTITLSEPALLVIDRGPAGASLEAGDTLAWTPSVEQQGNQRFEVSAVTSDGRRATTGFSVEVACETNRYRVGCGCGAGGASTLFCFLVLVSSAPPRRRRNRP